MCREHLGVRCKLKIDCKQLCRLNILTYTVGEIFFYTVVDRNEIH